MLKGLLRCLEALVKKRKKANKIYHILKYVTHDDNKIKSFDSIEELGSFIDNFYKEYPNYADFDSPNWIDYAITGITGDIHFFTDGIKVE